MTIPPELEAAMIRAGATVIHHGRSIEKAVSAALPPECRTRKKEPAKLLPFAFRPPATWLIGLRCGSLLNSGRFKRTAMQTAGRQRREVVRCLCRYAASLAPFVDRLADGEEVHVFLTRLGPGKVDEHSILGDHLKHVVDAVADCLATDDANPLILWRPRVERSKGFGVRIAFE